MSGSVLDCFTRLINWWSYGLNRWQLYKEIILPGAMPSILVGIRFSLGLVWVLLIVAETISAQSGIGYMTMNNGSFYKPISC